MIFSLLFFGHDNPDALLHPEPQAGFLEKLGIDKVVLFSRIDPKEVWVIQYPYRPCLIL